MIETVSNGILQISVKSLGAELVSLKTVKDGKEFLWQGDSKYWSGHSTVLFPVVGGLPLDKYVYDGKSYTMKPHGFARFSEFSVCGISDARLDFMLESSAGTLEIFPWSFQFHVTYTLAGNRLVHGFTVKNTDSKPMLFSVGAHPGFNCPLYENEDMEDYMLVFEKPETLSRRIKKDGLLSGERKPFMNGETQKTLKHSIFYDDAVILDSVKSNYIEIRNKRNNRVVKVDFEGFPYLGIWSAGNDAPFVCIEPWFGIDSTKGDPEELSVREGLQTLSPGGTFDCSYNITLK